MSDAGCTAFRRWGENCYLEAIPVYNSRMTNKNKNEGLRDRALNGDTTLGCWLALGSSLTAEAIGNAGFDWALIDLEHGNGTESEAIHQMQALAATPAASLVRVESDARQRAGRVLDLGAHGVMIPRIETAEQARVAASALRYPPQGVRGLAAGGRAAGYGADFERYLEWANDGILGIIQIETETIMSSLDEVASIDGVDVLFVGPKDLSAALGVFGQFDNRTYLDAIEAVVKACRKHGKAAGILLGQAADFAPHHDMGFRFIGCGSDAGFVSGGAATTMSALRDFLKEI